MTPKWFLTQLSARRLFVTCLAAPARSDPGADPPLTGLFAKANLVTWCIYPLLLPSCQ